MSACLNTALLSHNQQIPRYTSYPTAPHFSDTVSTHDAVKWLNSCTPKSGLSLYFHIPFCKAMCWYCGCNTRATKKYDPVQEYLAYLKKEITMVAGHIGGAGHVDHIHFGGGSPSYLHPDDFGGLMQHIHRHFRLSNDAEIAIELDPREVGEAKVAAYAQHGVTRASLGVQDFHRHVQQAINRVQPFHLVYEAVQLLKTYGIAAYNFDLLYGLPHQTTQIAEENAAYAAMLSPSRISLFGYAHVPWMKKHMRLIEEIALPTAPQRLEQFETAKCVLLDSGYHMIGIDHFVKDGDPMLVAFQNKRLKRNFQGYTTDISDTLIGFGSSAISAYTNGYTQNIPDVRGYYAALNNGQLPISKGIHLTYEDIVRRHIIEHIMCYGNVDIAEVCYHYGLETSIFRQEIASLAPLINDKLVKLTDQHIMVHPDAPQANRLAAAIFDTFLKSAASQQLTKRHAQVA